MADINELAERIAEVRERIAVAARKSGRDASDITLVAVSKKKDIETILRARELGLVDFGENWAQELVPKSAAISGVRWHFIGRLQTNKVKDVITRAALVHSLDRDRLAAEINRRALALGLVVPVLVEVNISGEASKTGFSPEELMEWLPAAHQYPGIRVEGLMTMAPWSDDPEDARPHFAGVKKIFNDIKKKELPGVEMKYLSMGMTDDFEVAVEEGANIVRIGRAIFGDR